MKINFHRHFEKQFSKLSVRKKIQFKERLALFVNDPYQSLLNNHPLRGKFEGYRSISVSGDIRAIYIEREYFTVEFVAIGTHSRLYK